MASVLTPDEIEMCRRAFATFDKDNSGTIDVGELKETLATLGQHPSDEELFVMISQVDTDNSGEIEFTEFLRVIETQKLEAAKAHDETDTIDAFVALGGNTDKSGKISTEKLKTTIADFELTIDIDALVREVDKDNSGFIEYSEFKTILS